MFIVEIFEDINIFKLMKFQETNMSIEQDPLE